MPFNLYTSSRLENLAAKLCRDIISLPLSDPFDKEVVVVQNHGMSVWLKQQIADKNDICANVDFLFINNFIKNLQFKTIDEERRTSFDFFEVDSITLSIYKILSTKEILHKDLQNYIKGDNKEIKCIQLSQKIAAAFDQYQIYRPEMILDWENGICKNEEHKWQAELWCEFSKNKISRTKGICNLLDHGDLNKSGIKRIIVFGITTMAPLFLKVFMKLGKFENIDLHFFYLKPSNVNWNIDSSERSSESLKDNCLKRTLGTAGREFYTLLSGLKPLLNEVSLPAEPDNNTTLSSLQRDIYLNTEAEGKQTFNNDSTLSVHSCHSKMREIEVVYDRILNILSRNSSIQPKDIIVAAPNISEYVPYITTVFNRRNGESPFDKQIHFSFSDITISQTSKVINAFFALLDLNKSKFRADDIMDILETESVRKNFSINDDQDLSFLVKWVKESGMCWGIDAENRNDGGFADFSENTLTSGLNRLLLGYATEADCSFNDNIIAAYKELDLSSGVLLGNFVSYMKQIFSLKKQLSIKCTVAEWKIRLDDIITAFFLSDYENSNDISKLKYTVAHLGLCSENIYFNEKISIDTVKTYLQHKLDSELLGHGFLKGRITFCTMLPMRNIPAECICLIGMNEGIFPRKETRLGFNIIEEEHRIGDRSKRLEDRYIFLEALIAARTCLYISYIGQNEKTNEIMPPAAPVSELLEYLKGKYGADAEKKIIFKHKLNSYNRSYFDSSDERFFSYSKLDCNSAAKLLKTHKNSLFSNNKPILHSSVTELNIKELISFFKNTSRYFINNTLRANLSCYNTAQVSGVEPFELNNLDLYSLNQDIIKKLINKEDTDRLYESYRLEDRLPVKNNGRLIFEKQLLNITDLYEKECKDTGSPEENLRGTKSLEVDFNIGGIRLYGTLDNVSESDGQQVYFQVASENSTRLLESWIKHLVFAASGKGVRTVCFIGKKEPVKVREYLTDDRNKAVTELEKLLEMYKNGLSSPLPFFPKASYKYAAAKENKINAALDGFKGGEWAKGDIDDLSVYLCFDESIVESEQFCKNSQTVLSNFLEGPKREGPKDE